MAKLLPLRGYALTGTSLIVEAEQFPLADIARLQVERATSRPTSALVMLCLALVVGLGSLGIVALSFFELGVFSLNYSQLGILVGVALLAALFAMLAWLTQSTAEYYLTLVYVHGKKRRLQKLEETSDAQKLCALVMQAKGNG